MKLKLNDIIKLTVAIILIIAATTKQHYNYYVFVRWTVFILALYTAYKTRHRPVVIIILISAVGILFNPIFPFKFTKGIWKLIDFFFALIILMTVEKDYYLKNLSPKRKLAFNLLKPIFIWSVVWAAFVIFILYPAVVDSFNKYLLFTKETIATHGFITEVYNETSSESDTQPGVRYDYSFLYSFITADGKKIISSASDVGEVPNEYRDLSHPYPVDVVYLKENPEINILKNQMGESLADSLRTEANIMTIFAFIVILGASFEVIKKAINKYKTESKNLISTNIN